MRTRSRPARFIRGQAGFRREPLQPKGAACTMELRFNYCLTLNGANTVPEDMVITRDRKVAEKKVGAIPVVDGCHAADTTIAITW